MIYRVLTFVGLYALGCLLLAGLLFSVAIGLWTAAQLVGFSCAR